MQIDRAKLRAEIRKLGNEHIFFMLDEALELLPQTKLQEVAKKYIDLNWVRPDVEKAISPNLLKEAKHFEKASLASEYYESFMVDSKNYAQMPRGTIAWIADYLRLLNQCVTIGKGNPAEVREAMDILFGLLNRIDECRDDVIFFLQTSAVPGRSEWIGPKVLPVWFKVLSATAEPGEYAERITALLSRHYAYGRDKMLAIARRTATD